MISDVYFPRINGVSTSIQTFRQDLQRQGIEVLLIAPEYAEAAPEATTVRVPSRRVVFDPEDRLMAWRPLNRKVAQAVADGVDIIHTQTPFAAHYAGVRAARRHGIPVLTTYHTHFEEYIQHYLPLLPRPVLRAFARRVARGQCNGLDAVVVPSPAMHATLRDYGVQAPLHVLPTGIPIAHFADGNGARFRACHGIAAHRPVALYVGRIAHEKNIGFLLEALRTALQDLPSLMLVVAGEGPALPALRQAAAALGIADSVRFVGYLDRRRELPDCYAAADVFAFASRTETQGLVLLEAMAAGLPVYALSHLGTGSIVEPQRGAVVAPDEPLAFGAGLAALLGNRPRLLALAAEAKRFAGEWSAPAQAHRLARLYRTLAENRRHDHA
ncbi:MAG TPA: glycosyltransferase [Rhodocyclaceae bacterium]|nr:glycosyltransferase [Rhodocyclaceae bacterium]